MWPREVRPGMPNRLPVEWRKGGGERGAVNAAAGDCLALLSLVG